MKFKEAREIFADALGIKKGDIVTWGRVNEGIDRLGLETEHVKPDDWIMDSIIRIAEAIEAKRTGEQ